MTTDVAIGGVAERQPPLSRVVVAATIGNVLEWCYDWYGDYPGGAVTDPTGPDRGYYRMARGGSWKTDVRVGRSAARSGGSAGRLDYTIGFRLALRPVQEKS